METNSEATPIHPESLREPTPEFIANLYENVTSLIASSGWYLVLVAVLGAVGWSWGRPHLERWQREREEKEEEARRHKNPDLYRTRQLAHEVARQRLQAEHDARARLAAEKASELETAKLLERVAKQSGEAGGRRLNEERGGTQQTSSRPEYNPLMGGGSSSGFRPTRRSCPGGGCG